MKGSIREVYRVLAAEVGWTLCGFCRYAFWNGSSCDGGWCECEHPIEKVAEQIIVPDDDCWGFRGLVNVSDMADIIGLMLSTFDSERTTWHKEKDGTIVVQGYLTKAAMEAQHVAEKMVAPS